MALTLNSKLLIVQVSQNSSLQFKIQIHENCIQITWKLNKSNYKIPSYSESTLRHYASPSSPETSSGPG